ncbi:hypothetical protein [Haloplanus natans]|uniref:hypothetical protein n=1 Tax=Haloplanus natans TaxID=376171 RepID=UPI000678115C|nr:hypothetical protein [Haloplanus natans]
MSTSLPTTDRTAPTLTDDTWRAESRPDAETMPAGARSQFATDCERRLYNLIDDENRVMF